MSFPRYKLYKESGVDWLREVPSGWNIKRVKHLFAIKKRISGDEGYEVLSITQQGIKVKDIESGDGQLSMDYSKYQFVEIGDFAMNHMDLLTGYVDISSIFGVTSPDYRVFCVRDKEVCFDRYYLYLFQMGYRNKIFYAFGQGSSQLGRWRFPTEQFNSFEFPNPSIQEQKKIAAFLDRETAKIDALIAEQQRLIALLKEKRQTIISQAVTKGLHPNAPRKDSGIEWLGEVPEHWDIRAVWLLFELGRGRVISHGEIMDNAGEYPVYSSQTENDGIMGRLDTYDFEGDYLTWTTDGAKAGTVFRRRGKFSCTNVCGTLKAKNDKVVLDYCVHALSISTASFVRQDINPKLMNNVMAKIRIPIPSPSEQHAIAAFLDRETAKIDILTAEAQRAITLLQERRTALIAAAVTGEIDVRNLTERDVA